MRFNTIKLLNKTQQNFVYEFRFLHYQYKKIFLSTIQTIHQLWNLGYRDTIQLNSFTISKSLDFHNNLDAFSNLGPCRKNFNKKLIKLMTRCPRNFLRNSTGSINFGMRKLLNVHVDDLGFPLNILWLSI